MIIKERDLYTQSVTRRLMSSGAIGVTTIQYEVRRYVDMRNLTSLNLYAITCTQRFMIPNGIAFSPTIQHARSFLNYPALITNSMAYADPDGVVSKGILLDFAPKTINTSVTSNQNQASSSNTSNTQQYSSGSTVSQTNSFTASASIGIFGDMPTGDLGFSSTTSNGYEQTRS